MAGVTTATVARLRRKPDMVPADVAALLRAGKLEQTCRACGRCEAAHRYCSWCFRAMGSDDWYRNRDRTERDSRMPPTAPANPPSEFRRTYRAKTGDGWPPAWGANPYERAPRTRRSRITGRSDAERDTATYHGSGPSLSGLPDLAAGAVGEPGKPFSERPDLGL